MNTKQILHAVLAAGITFGTCAYAEERQVNIYNWADYIGDTTLADFRKETNINTVYDVFDANETLEAKLLTGNTGYDIVVPSGHFLPRQIKAGVYAKLDLSKLPNYKNLDSKILKRLEQNDPGNQYAIPYMWGTSGIAYNKDKIKQALGVDHIDSWAALFDPEVVKKLHRCGVAVMDSPDELFGAVLHFMGKSTSSTDLKDYEDALELMQKIRPYITYFHSSKFISDLANGDICIAMANSGDGFQAMKRATEAHNGARIEYIVPKEGGNLWIDVLAIPADAKHKDEAHAFINFLLEPQNIAKVSDYIGYANPNTAADPMVLKELLENPAVYPSKEVIDNLYVSTLLPQNVVRWMTRAWTGLKNAK